MCYKHNLILYKRSKILYNIRNFFFKLGILEIETPNLTKYTVTDDNLIPLEVLQKYNNSKMWLITSPEFHMKRLLSRDLGPMYQICHVFRDQEIGNYHNIEFTMLEWYQPFYNMFDMMEIIELFFQKIFFVQSCDRISYRDIFLKILHIDPINTNIEELNNFIKRICHSHLIRSESSITELLDLIFLIAIQPNLGLNRPIFIYHYPANQAMLARINKNNINVADRFELFFKGIELGNGFYELIDSIEQRRRFDMEIIRMSKYSQRLIDIRFLNALNNKYMPTCSGVALGLDRIIMILCNVKKIQKVLSFSFLDC